MRAERRKRKRFQVENEAFAAFIRSNEPVIVGKIMDASSGGLAVHYLASGKLGEGLVGIRIFGPNLCSTDRIACKIVYDKVLAEELRDNFPLRRCGVEFSQIVYLRASKLQSPMSVLLGWRPEEVHSGTPSL